MDRPYLTADLPGIGGRIKQHVDDFRVTELPLYEPCGAGTHVYFRVRKAGVPTPAAIARIARYMSVRPHEIGVAGLKDAQAVAVQMMSLEHADPAKLAAYRDSQVQVIWTGRHDNKLRAGHLAGNCFDVRVRCVRPGCLATAQAVLDVLCRRGVPNYFGRQRFGARGDTAALGAALVRGDLDEFVAVLLGRPQPDDPPDCRAARDAFDTGALQRALKRWPRHYADERRALSAYRRTGRCGPALRAVDKRMKRLYVSAFQSLLFNEVLAQRLEAIDRVLVGDLARKTDTGGVFPVADAAEQDRADRFEISPTGPIAGYRCNLADGEPGRIERAVLAAHDVDLARFRDLGPLKAKGSRRALRFRIEGLDLSAGTDDRGDFLALRFAAPPGCYATVVLREIMKAD